MELDSELWVDVLSLDRDIGLRWSEDFWKIIVSMCWKTKGKMVSGLLKGAVSVIGVSVLSTVPDTQLDA